MPADCEIVGAEFDVQHGTIRLIVRSQQFEPIPVGVAPFTVAPTIHVTPERRVWDWNLGK